MKFSKTPAVLVLCVIFAGVSSAGMPEGVIAHWMFNEGSGTTAFDAAPNGHDGVIRGARYVPHGAGYALEFDGRGAHVDFGDEPAFRLGGQFTLEMWLKPCLDAGSHVNQLVFGKELNDYALTYNPVYGRAYMFVARRNSRGDTRKGHWNHVAGVFRENEVRFYINGEEAWHLRPAVDGANRTVGGALTVGGRAGSDTTYKGLVAEAVIYGRALSGGEIAARYRGSNLTGAPEINAAHVPPMEIIAADINTHPLGDIPGGASLVVQLRRGARVVSEKHIDNIRPDTVYPFEFSTAGIPEGDYTVVAGAAGPAGEAAGGASKAGITVSRAGRFPGQTARGVRLNNLVTELVNTGDPLPEADAVSFERESEGWTFISVEAGVSPGESLEIVLRRADGESLTLVSAEGGDEPPPWRGEGDTREVMRVLPAGRHELLIRREGKPEIRRIIVREVPKIHWNSTGTAPRTREERGPDWCAVRGLRSANSIVTEPRRSILPAHRPFIEAWRAEGRNVHINARLPHPAPDWPEERMNAGDLLEFWMTYHVDGVDGIILDEAHWRTQYAGVYGDAAREFHRETGQKVSVYTGEVFRYPAWEPFFSEAAASGGDLYWERYLEDEPTALAAWLRAKKFFADNNMGGWREVMSKMEPDMVPRTVLLMGTMLLNHRTTLDNWPQADWNVYFDLLLNTIVNEPVFEGIKGVGVWKTDFWEEEGILWLGRLYRHYFIEGRTGMLSDTPYLPGHIGNPGFEKELDRWKVHRAGPDSVRSDEFRGFGGLQGHRPWPVRGDAVAVLRRSFTEPNSISQTLKNLEPGRLYAVTMIASDFGDVSLEQDHGVHVSIEGVEEAEEYNHRWGFPNHRTSRLHPERGAAWLTYDRRVFRALDTEAVIEVSDWKDGEPAGPEGQEIMVGFVQVRPYRR